MIASLTDRLAAVWHQALVIWQSGGWAMWALAFIALVMFALGMQDVGTKAGNIQVIESVAIEIRSIRAEGPSRDVYARLIGDVEKANPAVVRIRDILKESAAWPVFGVSKGCPIGDEQVEVAIVVEIDQGQPPAVHFQYLGRRRLATGHLHVDAACG
jgi:hypothetical protein